jgi:hypothetical protein
MFNSTPFRVKGLNKDRQNEKPYGSADDEMDEVPAGCALRSRNNHNAFAD